MSSQCRKRNPRPSGHPSPISNHNLVDVADNVSVEIEKDENKNKYNTFLKLLSGETTVKNFDSNCIGHPSRTPYPEVVTDTGPMISYSHFKF